MPETPTKKMADKGTTAMALAQALAMIKTGSTKMAGAAAMLTTAVLPSAVTDDLFVETDDVSKDEFTTT